MKLSFPANQICCLCVLLLFAVTAFSRSEATNGKITGSVDISISNKTLDAKLRYEYVAIRPEQTHLQFYLNRSFSVKNASCDICRQYVYSADGRLPTIRLELKRPLLKNEKVVIDLEYAGDISGIYNAEHRFLELGLDWFWFPIYEEIGEFDFVYDLRIKTDVPEFDLVNNGHAKRDGRGWQIKSLVPDFDIDLVLADKLVEAVDRRSGYDIRVVSKGMPGELTSSILRDIRSVLDLYNGTFGAMDKQRKITAVFRPFPEVQGQGGYFRKGYFILPKPDSAESIFRGVAHELAHYWWLNAGESEAWLNESFAEYSALMAIRAIKGQKEFDAEIERKRRQNVDLPPVYGFDRTKDPRRSMMVLYVKGALKLHELETMIGKEKFLEFLRKTAAVKVRDTDQLLRLLSSHVSPEMSERFLAKLKE